MTGRLLTFRPQIFYAAVPLQNIHNGQILPNYFKGIENLPEALYFLHH